MEPCENIMRMEDKLKRAEELYGVDVAHSRSEETQERPAQTEEINYEEYFHEKHRYIHDTDYWKQRGLGEATIKKFGLGYDDAWVHPAIKNKEKITPTPRLIIPTGPTSYLARDTRPNETHYKKMRVGHADIFNKEALFASKKGIFVVEGELDAMSIDEVGGNAVALGSTTGANRFLRCLEEKKPTGILFLAFDTDTAGQKCTKTISDGLRKMDIPFETIDSFLGYHDANDALCNNKKEFAAMIENIENKVLGKEEKERNDYLATSNTKYLDEFLCRKEHPFHVHTGFTCLDDALGGGLYEGVYIFGAMPSLGKTTLILQAVDHMAQRGNDVLFFSLEMSRDELVAKSISRETICIAQDPSVAKTMREVTAYAFYPHSDEEDAVYKKAVEKYRLYADKIFVHQDVGLFNVKNIRDAVEKHLRLTGRKPIVVLDYIQLLCAEESMQRSSEKQVMDYSIMELKRISRDFKLPVIVISSLNRTSYEAKVELNSFKESGSLEYTGDCLVGLSFQKMDNLDVEREKNPREIKAVILKNRHGETGTTINFNYYAAYNYMEEVEEGLF